MAGQPVERGIDPQAKRKIGAFYLGRVLHSLQEKSFIAGMRANVDGMKQDFESLMNLQFPEELISNLGFRELQWRFAFNKNFGTPVPLLYWGGQGQYGPIDEALATVEVARRVDLENFLPYRETKDPMLVRVSGIDHTTNRIIAATYDAKTGDIQTATVSIGDDESNPADENYKGTGLNQYWRGGTVHVENHLQTSIEEPYEAPGLITTAMIEQTSINRSQAHTQLLYVGSEWFYSNQNNGKARGGITSGEIKPEYDADEVVIKFQSYSFIKRSAWEIRLPRKLPSATTSTRSFPPSRALE